MISVPIHWLREDLRRISLVSLRLTKNVFFENWLISNRNSLIPSRIQGFRPEINWFPLLFIDCCFNSLISSMIHRFASRVHCFSWWTSLRTYSLPEGKHWSRNDVSISNEFNDFFNNSFVFLKGFNWPPFQKMKWHNSIKKSLILDFVGFFIEPISPLLHV